MLQFKIDQNLPIEFAEMLRREGHDALTVDEQKMGGAPDPRIATVCRMEKRAVITLDLDFANIRNYPPQEYSGIIVLRPGIQGKPWLISILRTLIPRLKSEPLDGRRWIVEDHQVRIRGESPDTRAEGIDGNTHT